MRGFAYLRSVAPMLVIGAVALSLRLFYLFAMQVDIPLRADAGQYFRIALNVVQYGVFSIADPQSGVPLPDSFRAPGFPVVIALPLALGSDIGTAYWYVLLMQALIGAAIAMVMLALARRWLSRNYALGAGLLIAVWPHLITQGGYVLTETMFGGLVVGAIFLLVRASESGRPFIYAIAGATVAAAALVNQMIVLLPFLLLVCILPAKRYSQAAVFLVAALSLPALWAVRDAHIESPQGHSGDERLFENVMIGLEPDFVDYHHAPNLPAGIAAKRVMEGRELYAQDKSAAYAAVFARIRQDPLYYVMWFAQKPALLWQWSVVQGAGDIYVYPMLASPFENNPLYRFIAAFCYGLNTPLAVAAFVMALLVLLSIWRKGLRTEDCALLLCVLTFCYAEFVYTALTPDARYANPFRPLEIVLSVTLLARLAGYVLSHRAKRSNYANSHKPNAGLGLMK